MPPAGAMGWWYIGALWVLLALSVTPGHAIDLSDVVRGRQVIEVNQGQVMSLQRRLNITVRPLDKCTIYVKQNDKVTRKFGLISLNVFDCDVPKNVTFAHFGAHFPTSLHMKMRIKYEEPDAITTLPFTLQFNVVPAKPQIVQWHSSLRVNTKYMYSNQLREENVGLNTNYKTRECRMAVNYQAMSMMVLNEEVSLFPEFGSVHGDAFGGTLVQCSEFLSSGLYYKHEPGDGRYYRMDQYPTYDVIPIVVEALNFTHDIVTEYFMLKVDLPVGTDVEDDRPQPQAVNPTWSVGYQGEPSLVPLTSDVVSISDSFTDRDEIVIRVEDDKGGVNDFTRHGDLISTDNPDQPLRFFTQKDLRENKIAFRPYEKFRKAITHIFLRAFDSHGAHSERIDVMLTLRPRDAFAPTVVRNNVVQVNEGGTVSITDAHLSVDSVMSAREFNFRLVNVDSIHGYINVMSQRRNDGFTFSDIVNNQLTYTHDGDESDSANIILDCWSNSEENTTRVLLRILVQPIDNLKPSKPASCPYVVEITGGSSQMVTLSALRFLDGDSPDQFLTYSFYKDNKPEKVSLVRRGDPRLPGTSGGVSLADGSWTQRDIYNGLIFFEFQGEIAVTEIVEEVKLYVHDSSAAYNGVSVPVTVKVIPKDEKPPYPSRDSQMHVNVTEYSVTTINKYMLHYKDEGCQDPKDITYIVAQRPYDTNTENPLKAGTLQLRNADGLSVVAEEFTQFDINNGFLKFVPPSSERAVTTRYLEFGFRVLDKYNNELPNQVFSINLLAVDREPPRIYMRAKRIPRGGEFVFTKEYLHIYTVVQDRSTTLELKEEPQLGNLYIDDDLLKSAHNRIFNVDDIERKEFKYRQTLSISRDEAKDQFTLLINDGVNVFEVQVEVIITNKDQFVTSVSLENGQSPVISIYVSEGKVANINNAVWEYFSIMKKRETPGSPVATEISNILGSSTAGACNFRMKTGPRTTSGTPEYGTLEIHGKRVIAGSADTFTTINEFDCADATRNVLYKTNDRLEVGHGIVSKVDEMEFQVTLASGIALSELFRLRVNILPVDNQEPVITVKTPIDGLKVREGGQVTISNEVLQIEDPDTDSNRLFCLLSMKPEHGYLMDIKDQGIPISAFKYRRVLDGQIRYLQSLHTHRVMTVEPVNDKFKVLCTDFQHSSSADIIIKIMPQNDEAPILDVRMPLKLTEGSTAILGPPYFYAIDRDFPKQNLTINVISQPNYGNLVHEKIGFGDRKIVSGAVSSFPANYLLPSSGQRIYYQHDGSENFIDSIRLQLTDGGPKSAINNIKIIIDPLDDESPRLVTKKDLLVKPNSYKFITSNTLDAVDEDSDVKQITYVIRSLPVLGVLEKFDRRVDSFRALKLNENFTQFDIEMQTVVRYRPNSNINSPAEDSFKFQITDGRNSQRPQTVLVRIENRESIGENVTKTVSLEGEKRSVTLASDDLPWKDLTLDSRLPLYFKLITPPVNGRLQKTGSASVPTTFQTQEVEQGLMFYSHDTGTRTRMDCMDIHLLQEAGNRNKPSTFIRGYKVVIVDTTDEKPILTQRNLSVDEGSGMSLKNFIVVDTRNKPASNLEFMVNVGPFFGDLFNSQTGQIIQNNRFTLDDLNMGYIFYNHSGREPQPGDEQERMGIKMKEIQPKTTGIVHYYMMPNVTKSTNQLFDFYIQIQAIDDEVPYLKTNTPSININSDVEGEGRAGLTFQREYLRAEDEDTDEAGITFLIRQPPSNGIITDHPSSMRTISSFTQKNITDKKVFYILKIGTVAYNDSFVFDLVDTGGNRLSNLRHQMMWSYLSLEHNSYTVTESSGSLEINVRRRGFLNTTVWVGVQPSDIQTGGNRVLGVDVETPSDSRRSLIFLPNQDVKTWSLKINDDDVHEGVEGFTVELKDPVMAIKEFPTATSFGYLSAQVDIIDDEDMPVVRMVRRNMTVQESAGTLAIELSRTGDLSQQTEVYCYTSPDTAQAKNVGRNEEGDFEILPNPVYGKDVIFAPYETKKYCTVNIVNDELYEPEPESFLVFVASAIDNHNIDPVNAVCTITILPDDKDRPEIGFREKKLEVTEDAGSVTISIERRGNDLSHPASVLVTASPYPKSQYKAATAGEDFDLEWMKVEFLPGQSLRQFSLPILDDEEDPALEKAEALVLTLSDPVGASVDRGNQTLTIVIDDSTTDVPTMGFNSSIYKVEEDAGKAQVLIQRTGDISGVSTVQCRTRDGSALQGLKYTRVDTTITFRKGERTQVCSIGIRDDSVFGDSAEFSVDLVRPMSAGGIPARLAPTSSARILIADNDRPTFFFDKELYKATEETDSSSVLTVWVNRTGDLSQNLEVYVNSNDDNALASKDYVTVDQVLRFSPNQSSRNISIEILPDQEWEINERFILHMDKPKDDVHDQIDIKTKTVKVLIENPKFDEEKLRFPMDNIVISLKLLKASRPDLSNKISAGTPAICLTGCDPNYDFSEQSQKTFNTYMSTPKCSSVNNSRTIYTWTMFTPEGRLYDVNTSGILAPGLPGVLDSAFLYPGYSLECTATPVGINGQKGPPATSGRVVVVGTSDTRCLPPNKRMFLPAITPKISLSYEDMNTDQSMENSIGKFHLRVEVPHYLGLIPVVSVGSIRAVESLMLQTTPSDESSERLKCSSLNFLSPSSKIGTGFVRQPTDRVYTTERNEFKQEYRGENTVTIYKHLHLEKCSWSFDAYFTLSELVQICGATQSLVESLGSSRMSLVRLVVPVWVHSLRYRLVNSGMGWDSQREGVDKPLVFTYTTSGALANEWADGIANNDDNLSFGGKLYPQSITFDGSTSLMNVRLRSVPNQNFVGCYKQQMEALNSHAFYDPPGVFSVTPRAIEGGSGGSGCERQLWEITVSGEDGRDFSGRYTLKLVACKFINGACKSPVLVSFGLDLVIQTVEGATSSDFTFGVKLNFRPTQSRGFSRGDVIRFGLGKPEEESAELTITAVHVCQGKQGYIPQYTPTSHQYGCLVDNILLEHTIKLYDAEKSVGDEVAPFAVRVSDSEVTFKSDPLFAGKNYNYWVVQVIFKYFNKDSGKYYGREKRAAIETAITSMPKEVASIGDMKGTTINFIPLVEQQKSGLIGQEQIGDSFVSGVPIVPIVSVIAIVSIVLALFIGIMLARRQKRHSRATFKDKVINGHSGQSLYNPVHTTDFYPSSPFVVHSALKTSEARNTLPRPRPPKGQVMFSPQVTTISHGDPLEFSRGSPVAGFAGFMETSA